MYPCAAGLRALIAHGHAVAKHEQQAAANVDHANSVRLQREHLLAAAPGQIRVQLRKKRIIHSASAILNDHMHMPVLMPYAHINRACTFWNCIPVEYGIFQQRLKRHARNMRAKHLFFHLKTE